MPGKVYWTNQYADGAIYRANLDGSEIEEVIAPLPAYPSELTFDRSSGELYWVHPSRDGDRIGGGALMSANVDGTEPVVITDGVSGAFGLSIARSRPKFPVRAIGKR